MNSNDTAPANLRIFEQLEEIVRKQPAISRRNLCRQYNVCPVAFHRFLHRPKHLRGRKIYEVRRKELEPLVVELHEKEFEGIESIARILKKRGYVCSAHIVRKILRST